MWGFKRPYISCISYIFLHFPISSKIPYNPHIFALQKRHATKDSASPNKMAAKISVRVPGPHNIGVSASPKKFGSADYHPILFFPFCSWGRQVLFLTLELFLKPSQTRGHQTAFHAQHRLKCESVQESWVSAFPALKKIYFESEDPQNTVVARRKKKNWMINFLGDALTPICEVRGLGLKFWPPSCWVMRYLQASHTVASSRKHKLKFKAKFSQTQRPFLTREQW